MTLGKVIKQDGKWYTWCERNQCARNPFDDEGNEVLEILFGENDER